MSWTGVSAVCQVGIQRGTQSVTALATSQSVAASFASASYSISVAPGWNTTWWVTAKSSTGFTIEFGTPAPSGGSTFDWIVDGL